MKQGIGNLIALIVLTIGCTIVMVTVSLGTQWPPFVVGLFPAAAEKKPVAIPKTPVSIMEVERQDIEIVSPYTGMVRPFERYTLGFEIGGRLESLAQNSSGKILDIGDPVTAGQEIARLDNRLLTAQLEEAQARLEQAQTNMNRAKELREKGQRVITDAEYQNFTTQLQLAEAGLTIAKKRLADATLYAPVSGKISKRQANMGESVNPNQAIFEIVEVDRVLLVVGVPESQVASLAAGQPVHVELLARDKFREKLPGAQGTVLHVGETADDKTGLFEVEVLIDNADGRLRPGQVATARVVVDILHGYRLPMASAVFRDGRTILYTVGDDGLAHSLALDRWIEQGSEIIVPDLPEEQRRVVVRGQHRLVDGREVEATPVTLDEAPILQAELGRTNTAVGATP
jgi:RND family efflux transporter MFP subunit